MEECTEVNEPHVKHTVTVIQILTQILETYLNRLLEFCSKLKAGPLCCNLIIKLKKMRLDD